MEIDYDIKTPEQETASVAPSATGPASSSAASAAKSGAVGIMHVNLRTRVYICLVSVFFVRGLL